MKRMKNGAGFTLMELVISITISAVVVFAILSVITFTTTRLSASGIERDLQIDMNILAGQITDGVFDSAFAGGATDFGLRGAASYSIISSSQVNFTDTIGNTRSFTAVNGANGTLTYTSPTNNPVSSVIYRAPAGSVLNVVFSNGATNKIVDVTVSVTRTFNGKLLTGSVATSVYLRNAF